MFFILRIPRQIKEKIQQKKILLRRSEKDKFSIVGLPAAKIKVLDLFERENAFNSIKIV